MSHLPQSFVSLLVLVALCSLTPGSSRLTPPVATQYGPVVGISLNDSNMYLGIPFAKPPVADLRFKFPEAPSGWQSPLIASEFPAACPQFVSVGGPVDTSEDCLYLNVFTPKNATNSSGYPVMVWIFGGGFSSGSTTLYPGMFMVGHTQNVVVVTINYRLGFLGFFAHPDLLKTEGGTNFGLHDQQMAFTGVAENIEAFGGDPSQVTIFGESAGAISVVYHLFWQESWPFYHQAIIESGSLLPPNFSQVINHTLQYSSFVGCANDSSQLSCLRQLPLQALYNANTAPLISTFVPSIDGDSINASIAVQLNNSASALKPNLSLLIGNNANEGDAFAFLDALGFSLNQSAYQQITSFFFPGSSPQQKQKLLSLYSSVGESQGYWKALSELIGDGVFTCTTSYIADAVSKLVQQTGVGNVYRYEFTHRTKTISLFPFSVLNVTHFCEVPYVFFDGPFLNFSFTPEEWNLSDQIVTYWTNFAVYGDPNGPQSQRAGQAADELSLPRWPAYVVGSPNDTILVLDLSISLTNDKPMQGVCQVWDNFYAQPGSVFSN